MPFEIQSVPDSSGGGAPGPTGWGAGGEGHGGSGDAYNPSGSTPYTYYGYVVSGGGHGNQDHAATGGNPSGAATVHYYQGYWAGVQNDLYGFWPPEALPTHSYGFVVDPLGLSHPGIPSSRGAALGNMSVSHPMEMWLTPNTTDTGAGSWLFGTGADDWPADLPDWGRSPGPERSPGPLSPKPGFPGFSPINGMVRDIFSFATSDVPTEQEIQNAGNPALWLSSRIIGPMDPSLSSPGPGPDDMTPVFPPAPTTSTLLPFDITPGNTISDVTPRGNWTD